MKGKEFALDLARGASLGTGILPGVSVGTVSIIVGAYDKLIGSIANLRKEFVKSFLTLLPLALGTIISAIILLVFWQKVASLYFPFVIVAALAGFVIGGLPIILKELKGSKITFSGILRIILGTLLAAGIGIMSYLAAAGVFGNLSFEGAFLDPFDNAWIFPLVFVVGFIAAVACLIPGISGSMVVFIFGLYQPIVDLYISREGHPSIFHDTARLGSGLLLTLTIFVGAVLGLIIVSKAMKVLLEKHHLGTFQTVLGFVIGSLVAMFVNNQMYDVYHNPMVNQWWQFLVGGIALVAMAILTFILIRRKTQESN